MKQTKSEQVEINMINKLLVSKVIVLYGAKETICAVSNMKLHK